MEHELNELRPRLDHGRAFTLQRRPGFADCAPSGRVRLDALARWLQDVAYEDVEDAGLAEVAAWVVRRTRIRVNRFPRFGGRFSLTTFCSGLGRMWAERRTDIAAVDSDEPMVEAVSLWVHLDPASGRPVPLTPDEIETYGPAAVDQRVSARLRHPGPASIDGGATWSFRLTDCDIADHVNNSVYWQPLENELLTGPDPEAIDVELEYRTPAQPGEKLVIREADRRWIVDPSGELHASMFVRNGFDG